MRQVRRHKAVGSAPWRRFAPTLALLALLAGQALLPAFHFAAGAPLAPLPAAGPHDLPAAGHAHAGHGQNGHGQGEGGEQGGADHQACHFCRLTGAALPPPPAAVIALASMPEDAGIVAEQPLRPKTPSESRRPARAPPPIA